MEYNNLTIGLFEPFTFFLYNVEYKWYILVSIIIIASLHNPINHTKFQSQKTKNSIFMILHIISSKKIGDDFFLFDCIDM